MTAKHPRHIALTKPLAGYVDGKVSSGEYASASEVIRAALRLLIERDASQVRAADAAPGTRRRPHAVQPSYPTPKVQAVVP